MNFESLSLIIADGTPQSWPIRFVRNVLAQSGAFYVSAPGISKLCLVNLYVTVIRASKLPQLGRATMKSIATVWNGIDGALIGCSSL